MVNMLSVYASTSGAMVTVIACTFVLFPHLVTSRLVTATASQQYACMYILSFAAAVKQRLSSASRDQGQRFNTGW